MTDEQLMAYADGALPLDERDVVALAVTASPDLKARLGVFRATGEPIARAFDEIAAMPVPERIQALVRDGMPSGVSRTGVVEQRAEVSYRVLGALTQWFGGAGRGPALASLIAVASIAGLAGWALKDGSRLAQSPRLVQQIDGALFADGMLRTGLETVASSAADRAGSAIVVKGTFRSAAAEICREYVALGLESFAGVACRRDDGQWRIELHSQVAARTVSKAAVPASGPGTLAYEAALESVGARNVMTAEEEAAVLATWRNATK